MIVEVIDASGTAYRATPVAPVAEYLALQKMTGWEVLEGACKMLSRALLPEHPEMTPEAVAERFRPDGLIAALVVVGSAAIRRPPADPVLRLLARRRPHAGRG